MAQENGEATEGYNNGRTGFPFVILQMNGFIHYFVEVVKEVFLI